MIPIHWVYLAAMRFMVGFFTSSVSSLAPLLVAEVLDPASRGRTMMMFAVGLNFGSLIAYFVHLGISYDYNFYYMSVSYTIVNSLLGILFLQIYRLTKKYIALEE